jgi:hypothetical protein
MVGYPYTYNDYLSEEEAMQRRVGLFDEIVDKGLPLAAFCLILMPNTAFAADLPANPGPGNPGVVEAPGTTPAPGRSPSVFAPVAFACKCASPRVKTAILLVGISSICYSALCSNDKTLLVACTSIATYVGTKLAD